MYGSYTLFWVVILTQKHSMAAVGLDYTKTHLSAPLPSLQPLFGMVVNSILLMQV